MRAVALPAPDTAPPPPAAEVERCRPRLGGSRLWAGSVTGAVLLHAAALAALVWRPDYEAPPAPPVGAMMVEMAPLPQAPPTPAEQPREHKRETPPEPKPMVQPRPRLPPVPKAAVSLPTPDPAKPEDMPRREEAAIAAPAAAEAERVAAPSQGQSPIVSGDALPTWQGALRAHLEKHKRYPALARAQRRQGGATIRFVMDREGRVLSAALESSSGHESLDEEALSLPQRAQPLPVPPEGVGGERIELLVPIRFYLR